MWEQVGVLAVTKLFGWDGLSIDLLKSQALMNLRLVILLFYDSLIFSEGNL